MSITTILALANQQHLAAQEVATKAPPASSDATLPDLPFAAPISVDDNSLPLTIEADTESQHGDIYRLEGSVDKPVVITYHDHILKATRITYDRNTHDTIVDGNVQLTGGENDESIHASHGTYNMETQTGKFYDVNGSVGMHTAPAARSPGTPGMLGTSGTLGTSVTPGTSAPNPFLFSGRIVIKTGPENYDIYEGEVTSCLLPNPDWQLSAQHFSMDAGKARAYKSTFHLLNMPIFFLPYVTHPIDNQARQSGLLIPVISQSSTKGFVFGDEVYLVLGRSADVTLGLQYFSLRGFSEAGSFRYRGAGDDFLNARFSALQDRGIVLSGILTNQGGQDITLAFRKKLTSRTRVVADAEYLSSYVYREAFNENFNQAVSSDITSVLFAVNQQYGFSTAVRTDRYQGLKLVPIGTQPGEQVRIFHAPSIDFTALDRHIGNTPFLWSMDSSIAGLKRSQPNFTSSGIIERMDLRPELSLPFSAEGWHTLSSIAVRETFYSRSRKEPYGANATPHELTAPLNRNSLETQADLRAPAIERDFTTPKPLAKLLGPELRHTVEPEFVYRDVRGIGNFLGVLRFDDIDVASNTNELEYGVTQRLFARRSVAKPDPCLAITSGLKQDKDLPNAPSELETPAPEIPEAIEAESASGIDANGIPSDESAAPPRRSHAHTADLCKPAEKQQQEWVSWRLTQRRFFDPNFGGAVINNRRNIFDTTLNLSGIAFLTEARDISPLISRLRIRTSSHTDFEWDFDLDTGAKKFTSSNIYIDSHVGQYFGGIAYARLNAPGRFYIVNIDITSPNDSTLTSSAVSDFSQLRFLAGYGTSSKPGLSLGANANLDLKLGSLQYAALQSSYNWNCCGLSIEYRKYELGSVRNEGTERFSFTLLNIGTAGNLRKTERVF